jgi:hypothetical protein
MPSLPDQLNYAPTLGAGERAAWNDQNPISHVRLVFFIVNSVFDSSLNDFLKAGLPKKPRHGDNTCLIHPIFQNDPFPRSKVMLEILHSGKFLFPQ